MQQLGGPLRQGFFALGSLHTSSLQALRACSSYATSCSQLDQPSIQSWFENVQGSSATKTEANSLPSSSCQSRVNTCSFASGVLYFRPRACSAMGPPRCSLGPPRAITDTLAPYQSLTGLYESHRLYSSLPEQPASSSAPSEPGGSPQKHPRDSKERTADQGSSAPASEPGSSAKVGSFEGMRLQLPGSPFASKRNKTPVQKQVLYRGKGMLLFRVLVRAKVFQVLGIFTSAMFVSALMSTGNPDPQDLAAVAALALGCIITSYCTWYYSGRYVGELSLLLPQRNTVRFSVLDFWGNREDNDIPVERIEPPWRNRSVAEVRASLRAALLPINVQGDRQYYISVAHGHILDKEVLQKLLYGKLDKE